MAEAIARMTAVEGKRLLVLGAGPAQLGLLAAARRLGVTVVAADRDPSAPGFRYADRRAIVSIEDEPALDRLARAERIDGVVAPGSDRPVAIAARIAAKLGVPHPLAPGSAALTSSRQRERERLAEAGIPQPASVLCRTAEEIGAVARRLGYPCAVTGADRQGRRILVTGAETLAAATAQALAESRTDLCLVEEVVDGLELAVNAFSLGGRFHPLTVTDILSSPLLDVALALAWPNSADPALAGAALEAAAAAAAALGVAEGPSSTQVVLGPEGPLVLRAAARLGGDHDAELCRAALGVDLNALTVRTALGEPVAEQELVPAEPVGAACVRFLPAPPGELRRVSGLEEAYALPGVRGIRVYRRPGHVFAELQRPSDRAGAVLAVGAGRGEALATAGRAVELIRLDVVDVEALV